MQIEDRFNYLSLLCARSPSLGAPRKHNAVMQYLGVVRFGRNTENNTTEASEDFMGFLQGPVVVWAFQVPSASLTCLN